MAKTKTFEITKDFGDKTLKKVFVKDDTLQDASLSLRERIISALAGSQTVCIVAESALGDELIQLLRDTRAKNGIRIYIIVKDIQAAAFESLRGNCIVREVRHISGNYMICGTTTAFFFNSKLEGYEFNDAATVGKLHDIFIYEFWNNAEQEFVNTREPAAERTFDVAPAIGNDTVIIDRSALENRPYDSIVNNADAFTAQGRIGEFLKLSAKQDASFYLDKKACEAEKDWLMKSDGRNVIYTDGSIIPLCKSSGGWYAVNNRFDKEADNTGNFFAVKMEKEPVFTNSYTLKDSFSYRDAVGKSMLQAKDFIPIAIAASESEERSISFDYKRFKKILKMSDGEREAEFDKIHLLVSDKLAASVNFTVTMTVKKLSKGAVLAPVYKEYEDFIKRQKDAIDSCKKATADCERNIQDYTAKLQEISASLEKFGKKKTENDKHEQDLKGIEDNLNKVNNNLKLIEVAKVKLRKLTTQQDKPDEEEIKKLQGCVAKEAEMKNLLSKFESRQNELNKAIAEFKRHAGDGVRLESQKDEMQKKLDNEVSRQASMKDLIRQMETLSAEPQTVKECSAISAVLKDFNFQVPAFDKPKYGTLYKVKSGYEYELSAEANSDAAEVEMKAAGLENVEFVEISG